MAVWMCERQFEITVEGMPAVVPIRFVVEAATEEEARGRAVAASEEAFRTAAGDGFPGNPASDVVVLYGM
jgi:hypothetical protein